MALLLGLMLFAGVIGLSGNESLYKLGHLRPGWLLAACGGVGLMLWIFSWRWRIIADAYAGRDLGTSAAFFFYSITASATSLFMPQTANVVVVRTAMLSSFAGIPVAQAGASVLIDKLFDLLPVMLLVPPALIVLFTDISLQAMLAAIIVELVVGAFLIRRYHTLYPRVITALLRLTANVASRVPVLKRLKAVARLGQPENVSRLQGDTIQAACLLTLIGTMAMLLRSWLIARSIGVPISPLEMLAGIALAQAGLILAVTPGALGTLELSWYLGLTAAGVPSDYIGPFLIAHRVLQSVFVLLIYFLSYLSHLVMMFKTQRSRAE
jgi:uncharacterized protein (TIRG00374 family)